MGKKNKKRRMRDNALSFSMIVTMLLLIFTTSVVFIYYPKLILSSLGFDLSLFFLLFILAGNRNIMFWLAFILFFLIGILFGLIGLHETVYYVVSS